MTRNLPTRSLASIALCTTLLFPPAAAQAQTEPPQASPGLTAFQAPPTDANGNPLPPGTAMATDANGNPVAAPGAPMPMATDANGNPIALPMAPNTAPMVTDANGNPVAVPAAPNAEPMVLDANGNPITPPAAQPQPTPVVGTGSGNAIKRMDNGLCLEPGHPLYDSGQEVARHPTMRACIAQGGQRDVRTDPLTAGTAQSTTNTPAPNTPAMPDNNGLDTANVPTGTIDPATGLPDAPGAGTPRGLGAGIDPATGLPSAAIDPATGLPTALPPDTVAVPGVPGPMGAQPTAEEIARLRALGMPVDADVMAAYGVVVEPTQEVRQRPVASGPKGITLPEQPSYSKEPSIFRNPAAYVGRSAQDFAP